LSYDSEERLYGATGVSAGNSGVVFELTTPKTGTLWTDTVFWTFTGGNVWRRHTAEVVLSGSNLLGTTSLSGQ
jgi:hypothetical protein